MIFSACCWVTPSVNSVRGSCSVVCAPVLSVVVVDTTVVVPTAITSMSGSSRRVKDPRPAPPVEFMKIATLSPGLTKPATRAVSVRLIDIAIIPLGMVSALVAAAVVPNLLAMICSPG